MRRINVFLVFGVFFLAALLALYRINDCHLWIDEFFSINIAQRPLSDIWSLSPHPGKFYWNTMPPLYETVLHFFWDISGKNILLPRLLSVSFHLFALYFLFKLTSVVFNRNTAFIAVFLASMNAGYIYYSKMIRCYSFLNMLTILSLYLFFRIVKLGDLRRRCLAGIFLVNVFILYTFYFGAFVILMEIAMFLFLFRRQAQRAVSAWLISAFLPFLIWVPHLLRDLTTENAVKHGVRVQGFFDSVFLRFHSFFYDRTLFLFYVVIFLAVSFYGTVLFFKKKEPGVYVAALACFLLIPVLIINLLTSAMAMDPARIRYTFIFMFPFFVLSAYAIVNLRKIFRIAIFIVFFAVSLKSFDAYAKLSTNNLAFWPAPIALLSKEARDFPVKPHEKVLIEIQTDLYMPLFVYYFYGPEFLRPVSYPDLWANYKMLKQGIGPYKIVYNIACLNVHLLLSVDMIPEADWLFLFYSDWSSGCWGPDFIKIYLDKAESRGLRERLVFIERKKVGAFSLAIFKVEK